MNSETQLEHARQALEPIMRNDVEVSFIAENRFWWCVARSTKKGWPLGVAQGNSPDEAAQRLLQRYQLRQQQEHRNKIL